MSARVIVAAVVFLPLLVGILLLGIAAYRGHWHSWHGNDAFFHWPYTPLAGAWFGASGLLVVPAFAVAAVAPASVVAVLAALAVVPLVISIVVYVHPPRWLLPRYVRWLEGDEEITERPACLEAHRHSRIDAIMRAITFGDRREPGG